MSRRSPGATVPIIPYAPATWLRAPRLAARGGLGAAAAGVGALLVLAALGAALVHILEYHLGLGHAGDRLASLRFMLAHCPVRGGLLVVLFATLLTLLALLGELRVLMGRQRRLMLAAQRYGVATPLLPARPPLHGQRLVALLLPLLVGQVGLYALAGRLWPMTFSMRMHGAVMAMTVQGAIPLVPLHLVVALLLALFVWRLERRFTMLHAAIAAVRRLLAQARFVVLHVSLPARPSVSRLSRYCGPAALSRPPPAGSLSAQ